LPIAKCRLPNEEDELAVHTLQSAIGNRRLTRPLLLIGGRGYTSGMSDPDLPMLMEARAKAERLVAEVRRLAAEKEANPPPIPPKDLRIGQEAMAKAVAAAERTLASIEDAIRCLLEEQTGHN
jgi:hypothetical protein